MKQTSSCIDTRDMPGRFHFLPHVSAYGRGSVTSCSRWAPGAGAAGATLWCRRHHTASSVASDPIDFHEGETINEEALKTLGRAAVSLNQTRGCRSYEGNDLQVLWAGSGPDSLGQLARRLVQLSFRQRGGHPLDDEVGIAG